VIQPPESVVVAAVAAARASPCVKSKRGAVVFLPGARGYWNGKTDLVISNGYNGPPAGVRCDGSDLCRASCRYRCEHAESRAVMQALLVEREESEIGVALRHHEIVHVKIGADGDLVGGGPPSCTPCAVRILDVGLGAVWLYETSPEEWCPHLDMLRIRCPLCQGEACDLCRPGTFRLRCDCDHDVLDRHHGHPVVDARWRRYTAADFHRVTTTNKGIY
jgi:deoxycytidylate deaminase